MKKEGKGKFGQYWASLGKFGQVWERLGKLGQSKWKEEAEKIRKGNKNLSGKEEKKEEKLRSRIRRRLSAN